jgi:ABC-type multidrug transport system permease subunit
MAFGEMLIVLVFMVAIFDVPIAGNLALLLALSGLFIVTVLALGLLISTVARSQLQALQLSFLVMLPSVLLSGFMFPRSEMPLIIYLVSGAFPVTYYLEILRGVILRGADFGDLLPHVAGLAGCCVVIFALSLTRFSKQIA